MFYHKLTIDFLIVVRIIRFEMKSEHGSKIGQYLLATTGYKSEIGL